MSSLNNNGSELGLEEDAEEFSEDSNGENEGNLQSDNDDSSDGTASEDEVPWILWFITMRGNDFFCEVEESFIQDDFNLTGLSSQVPYYDYALDVILDVDISHEPFTEDQHEIIETAAEVLYGLIHARYILTAAGMQKMYEKFQNVDFGRCPRSFCQGQPVLPVGLSDITREFSVEVFCPRCHDTYHPRSSKHSNLDGAYFGTTFCHLFLLTHPDLIVSKPAESYVPRIFGFRINESSPYYKMREPPQRKKSSRSSSGASGSNKGESGSGKESTKSIEAPPLPSPTPVATKPNA
eukprot:gene3859-2743_t